jgi:hypothetical protein
MDVLCTHLQTWSSVMCPCLAMSLFANRCKHAMLVVMIRLIVVQLFPCGQAMSHVTD